MSTIPIMVDLRGKDALIIGGGNVAYKRANLLCESEARITIVSPELSNQLKGMWQRKEVKWKKKKFEPEDLQGAYIVVIATNDTEVNEQVLHSAKHVPFVNVASHAERGNVQFSNYISRGKLTISISTNGASPKLSSKIKKDLEKQFDERYEAYVDFLYECRQRIKHSSISKEEQNEILSTLLSEVYFDKTEQDQFKDWLELTLKGGQKDEGAG
ncbi:NAD(P)-binding protein [Pontibacillus marinus]|uniref:precorrin-2 dehydrogenase n=1 Tax=Pontibacillus marinus BH030004 = DSM 16465 TaxID=1385511 RepID=A0A0A5I7J9_9BACI|nr:NAD(P)-binding protein [Pontibacillus marinus]KGX91812.1 precorrin-2 dehydrogenase [Pontibacillus marinus BH030004 = DSM 16465]